MKIKHFVRQSLFFSFFLSLLFIESEPRLHAELLPAIDARAFDVTPIEISKSGRIYRFRVVGDPPRTGSIILLELDKRPIMAFRVMQNNLIQHEMIAKRVRRYDVEGKLELNHAYIGAEKIADRVITPQSNEEETAGTKVEEPATPAEQESAPKADPNAPAMLGDDGSGGPEPKMKNAKSLEGFDEELDSTTTPRNLKKKQSPDEGEEDLEDDAPKRNRGPAVEERESLIKYPHMMGVTIGSFRNMSNFQWPGVNSNGFTAYYNEIVDKGVWFRGQGPQDSLSLEGGLGFYSRMNLTGIFDNYDILPIRTEILYTLQFSPSFAFLSEVGAQYNWVISTDKATTEGVNQVSGFQPNFGIGFLYNIGPQWYVRGDLGLDRVGIGLAVKW